MARKALARFLTSC